MAYETNVGLDFTLPAGSDLSGNQFYAVKLNSSTQLVLCDTTANEGYVGILQEGGSAAGRSCSFRYGGVTKVIAGGSFNPGDKLTPDSAGKLVKATAATVFTGTPYKVSGSQVVGIALAAGTAAQTTTMLCLQQGFTS